MSAASERSIDEAILEAGLTDYLDVWFITQVIEDMLGSDDPDEVRPLALAAIERLLRQGELRVGHLEPPGEFVASRESPDAAFRRIQAELRNLDRELRVGDIAWFEVPGGVASR
jgi:hypothetical protein